jgi:hypothetical protein
MALPFCRTYGVDSYLKPIAEVNKLSMQQLAALQRSMEYGAVMTI